MTSFELLKALERFSEAVNDTEYVLDVITSLAATWLKILDKMGESLVADPQQLAVRNNEARAIVGSALTYLRGQKPSQIFVELPALSDAVRNFIGLLGSDVPEPVWSLPDLIGDFTTLYERTVNTHGLDEAVKLSARASELDAALAAASQMTEFLKASLTRRADLPQGFEEMTVYLPSQRDLPDVTKRLESLNELYERLCNILEISYQQNRLLVVHLEVGSVFLKIAGNGAVLSVIREWLAALAGWLYRQYTQEGRVASIPRKAEAIEAILKMKQSLAEHGVDSQRLDPIIENSALAVATELYEVLRGQREVTIDGHKYELVAGVADRQMGTDDRKLLTSEPPEKQQDTSDKNEG